MSVRGLCRSSNRPTANPPRPRRASPARSSGEAPPTGRVRAAWHQEDRERVVEDAPGNGLGDRQRGNDPPARAPSRARWRRDRPRLQFAMAGRVSRHRCSMRNRSSPAPAPQQAAAAPTSAESGTATCGCTRRSRAARARPGAQRPSHPRARRRPSGPARSRCAAGRSARDRSSSCPPRRCLRPDARARRRRAAAPIRTSADSDRSAARAHGRPRRDRRDRAAAPRAWPGRAGTRSWRSARRRRSLSRRRSRSAGRPRGRCSRV